MSDYDAAVFMMTSVWPPPPAQLSVDITDNQMTMSTWCYAAMKDWKQVRKQWSVDTRLTYDTEGRLDDVPSKTLNRAAKDVFNIKCLAYFGEDWLPVG